MARSLARNLTPQAETPRATTMLALGFSRRARLRARAQRLLHYALRSEHRALLLHSEQRALLLHSEHRTLVLHSERRSLLLQHRLFTRAFSTH